MLRSMEVRSRTGCGLAVREGCCAFASAKSEATAVTVRMVRVITIAGTLILSVGKTKNGAAFNSFSSESSHRRCGLSTDFRLRLACRELRSPEFCLGLKPANPDRYGRRRCADLHRLQGFPGPAKSHCRPHPRLSLRRP